MKVDNRMFLFRGSNRVSKSRSRVFICSAIAGLILLSACGGRSGPKREAGQVAGEVKLEGVPVDGVSITFESTARGIGASASVKDGHYKFGEPVAVGEYQVTITPVRPAPTAPPPPPGTAPPQEIPIRYQRSQTSGLVAEVKTGSNQFDFDLKRK